MDANQSFTFCEDGGRPRINLDEATKFRVQDKVYVAAADGTRRGPYTVALVDGTRYKLCDGAKKLVCNGEWVTEGDLTLYNEFA